MERLAVGQRNKYNVLESAIHLNRYLVAKQFCEGKRVLDIACGEGYGTYAMGALWGAEEVWGIDCSTEAIQAATEHYADKATNIHYATGNAEEHIDSLEDKSFDLIVSFETIEHLNNPMGFLEQITRLLKENGTIIISCPNDYYYYPSDNERNPYHMKKYTFEDFKLLCETKLGAAQKYMFGLPISGFSNVIIDSPLIQENEKSMDSMFEYERNITHVIPSEGLVAPSNSSYFVGVWGKESVRLESTSCTFSNSMDNTDYMIAVNAREEVSILSEKNERISDVNDQLNKELSELNTKYNEELAEMRAQLKNITDENIALQYEMKKSNISQKGLIKENELLRHNSWVMQNNVQRMENDVHSLQNKVSDLSNEMNVLLNSHSWKITAPLRRVVNMLRK